MVRIVRKFAHELLRVRFKLFDAFHHSLCAEISFQIIVEILIRIVFRRIGRKIKKPDFFLVCISPLRHRLAVMNSQIVENQIHFSPIIALDDRFHKRDEPVGIYGIRIKEKM